MMLLISKEGSKASSLSVDGAKFHMEEIGRNSRRGWEPPCKVSLRGRSVPDF